MAENSTTQTRERTGGAQRESTRGGLYFSPRVDIFETDKELTLYAEVPGVRAEDVDLRYEKGELMLHAKVQPRQKERHVVLLQEFEEGDFYRAFTIHESINASKIEAECKNGVLIVHLPKVEAAQPRQINVRAV